MPIYIVSKQGKKILFKKFVQMNNISKFTGLLFKKSCSIPLLFSEKGRISIHSFFCPEFDALFLNEKGVIVKATTVKPCKVLNVNCFFLFECPPGSIERFKLKKGDKLQWMN